MKKLFQLTMLMFALVLINTGCEKTEEVEPKITVSELIGYWNFVQAEYNGFTYTNCDQVSQRLPDELYGAIIFNMNITPAPIGGGVDWDANCDLINVCKNGTWSGYIYLDTEKNRMKIANVVYEILEYNKLTKKIKLMIIEPVGLNYIPINAIFTWQKQ